MQTQDSSQEGSWNGQQQQQQTYPQAAGSSEEIKTLWIGDLQYWMDENYLWGIFAQTGEAQSVKIIRNKLTGQSEGYGFIEFVSRPGAERVLLGYSGQLMPQTEQPFRLNWASFGLGEKRQDGQDHSIFVGDLAADVNDYMLTETFRVRYPTVKGAKVVIDTVTGRSKGYGFVRFGSQEERDRALAEMNGEYCSTRPMRISIATPKKAVPVQATRGAAVPTQAGSYGAQAAQDADPANTTIFVGGLDPTITDEILRASFSPYGELVYVKIPYGKGCGFVQFSTRASADEAIRSLHGTVIGQQAVRLSWGRNPSTKQVGAPRHPQAGWGEQDPNAWNAQAAQGAYYQPQVVGYGGVGVGGYDQYGGYAGAPVPAVAPDSSGYYGGYAAYQQPAQAGFGGYQAPAGPRPTRSQQSGDYQTSTADGGMNDSKDHESFDPSVPPNVDRMNQAFIASNDPSKSSHLWLKPADQVTV